MTEQEIESLMMMIRRMASTGAPKLAEEMILLVTASDEIQIKGDSKIILIQAADAIGNPYKIKSDGRRVPLVDI